MQDGPRRASRSEVEGDGAGGAIDPPLAARPSASSRGPAANFHPALAVFPMLTRGLQPNELSAAMSESSLFPTALAAFRRHDYATAQELARQILKKKRNDVNAIMLLAEVANATQDHREALAQLTRAIRLDPKNAVLRDRLGTLYQLVGDDPRALVQFEKALKLDPAMLSSVAGIAEVREFQGKKDKARSLLEPHRESVTREPRVGAVLMRLLASAGETEDAIAIGERMIGSGAPPSIPLRDACFQLARAYEKTGDIDKAMDAAGRGNAMLSPPFNAGAYEAYVDRIIGTFSREFIASAPRPAAPDPLPVFIVGVPRCGSTLTERILDAHSAVHGAGELRTMFLMVRDLPGAIGSTRPFPECAHDLTAEAVEKLAASYLGEMRRLGPRAGRVSNKDLGNFLHLGLINVLMPAAQVIHCRRDPVDTCLSCYLQSFAPNTATFTNDLRSLGLYYRQYQRLMEHWHAVLDLPMLDVDYEELVRNQEPVTRRVLDFVGLPWEEGCLGFHETNRVDRTLSYEQVRQPLYQSSVGRAERFGAHLDPLREALGL